MVLLLYENNFSYKGLTSGNKKGDNLLNLVHDQYKSRFDLYKVYNSDFVQVYFVLVLRFIYTILCIGLFSDEM